MEEEEGRKAREIMMVFKMCLTQNMHGELSVA